MIIKCKDCKYWLDQRIMESDRRERKYRASDFKGNELIDGYVTLDVGVNIGAQCTVEEHRGYNRDMKFFRNGDDFCSRGEKREVPYDKWWGIDADGYYPEEEQQ